MVAYWARLQNKLGEDGISETEHSMNKLYLLRMLNAYRMHSGLKHTDCSSRSEQRMGGEDFQGVKNMKYTLKNEKLDFTINHIYIFIKQIDIFAISC